MEKIIYNNKLKKLLISTLLVMMLMTYVRPIRVFATDEEGYEVKTYAEWVTYTGDKKLVETETRLYFESHPNYINNYNDEQRSKEIDRILSEPDKLKLIAKYTEAGFFKSAKFDIKGHGFVDEEGEAKKKLVKTYAELINWSGDSASELDPQIASVIQKEVFPGVTILSGGTDPKDVAKMILELNKSTIKITIFGTKDDFEITDFEVPGKTNEELAIEAGKAMGVETNDHETPVAGGNTFEYENGNYTSTGTIRGTMQSMTTMYESLETGKSIATLMGRCASDQEKKDFETNVKTNILNYLKKNNLISAGQKEDDAVNQIYNYYKNNSVITVKVGGTYNLETPGYGASCEVKSVQISLTKDNVNQAISAGEVEGVDTSSKYVDEYGQESSVDTDSSGRIIKEEEEEEKVDGGILLEPLFALVNFIADTINSFLGEFMIGEDGMSGRFKKSDLLPDNLSSLAKDDVYRVSTKSFVNVLGTRYFKINYTPEKIFSGEVPILSVDFISGKTPQLDDDGNIKRDDNGDILYTENPNSDWRSIRKVISDWYKVLRMIAIIGLLSVLIYTGIKIIISANAKDKAKYKEWIINWFIAVAILFSMHYIMSFVISVTTEISGLLNASCKDIIVEEVASDSEMDKSTVDTSNVFTTNLMGLVRYMVQSDNAKIKIGYEVMYIALLTYTVKFTFIYLKRVLNMAFLTLIAPIVALTYPLDKINDGQAQGFNMWLKEYIFNALLQPMHLILYYILVGSAVGIAASNPLYGIVVLMFMTEAEKLLKKIFGFDKAGAGTVGGMAGAFAAGAIASNIKNIAKMSKLPVGNGGKDGPGLPKNDVIDSIKGTHDASDMTAFGGSSTPPAIGGSESAIGGSESAPEPGSSAGGTGVIKGANIDSIEAGSNRNASGTSSAQSLNQGEEPISQSVNQGGAQRPQNSEDVMNTYENNWANAVQEGRVQNENGRASIAPRESNNGASQSSTHTGNNGASQSATHTGNNGASSSSAHGGNRGGSPSQTPARDLAKKKETTRLQRFGKGMKAVGKSLARPIYDFDRSGKYNAKRWGRRILRAGIGGAVGITAAAVQAGISITDGKYNPMEGIATFAAGYAGGGQIFKGLESLKDTYYEGANAGDKEAQLKRAQSRYADRDDVIEYNKRNFAGREKEVTQRQRDNWMKYGYTDPKQMKSGIKYADAWIKQTYGDSFARMSAEDKKRIWEKADDRAAQAMAFKDRLKDQGQSKSVWDDGKRDKYIEQMVKEEAGANASETDKQRVKAKYEEAFKAVREYDNAQ